MASPFCAHAFVTCSFVNTNAGMHSHRRAACTRRVPYASSRCLTPNRFPRPPRGRRTTRRWKRPMSTIPLTLVDGAVAMPRLRPLDLLPAHFGRDWALLPPGQSWRAELKALYAAVLRTFCMSDKVILSFCRWVPLNARLAAAAAVASAAASAAREKRATVFHPVPEEALHVFAEESSAPVVEGPLSVTSSRGAPPHWKTFAGGACALGGAAMLAWIAFGHVAQRQTIEAAKPADTVAANRDSQLAERRAPDVATARGSANVGETKVRTRNAESTRADTAASASVPARSTYAPTSVATKAVATPRVANSDSVARRRHTLRDTVGSQREKARRHLARSSTAANLPSHVAAMADEMPLITVPRSLQRSAPRPSAAGRYSPLAPAQLGFDEYADVTMSAATHLRDIAPLARAVASRPAPSPSSNHSSAGSGTEWMNHMSQRRVTEVPDQFAK
jgi:hypothetical protein